MLTEAQKTIAKDTTRFRVLNCGRRFGKTFLAVEEMKGCALYKESKIAYIAPTFQQARDIAWEMLKKELRGAIKSINDSRLELTINNLVGSTSVVSLRSWDAIETLRGQSFDFIVLDEVASMRSFWIGWQEVLRPTLTDRKGHAMFISTPKGFNHFFDLYNKQDDQKTGQEYKSFHFTTYDNPHIPVEEIESARIDLPEDRFAQEYLADFRKAEGLVYKEFSRDKHLFDDNNHIRVVRKIAGIDFGFTNPTAVLEIWIDYDSHYWVRSEWYKTGKTNAEVIEYLKTLRPETIYPDPAEPDRIKEIQDSGFNTQDVSKDIEKGIDSVVQLLRNGRLHIHRDCKNLISELETYRYPEKRSDGNTSETPVKENDHALDALRYAVFNTAPIYQDDGEEFNLYSTKYR